VHCMTIVIATFMWRCLLLYWGSSDIHSHRT